MIAKLPKTLVISRVNRDNMLAHTNTSHLTPKKSTSQRKNTSNIAVIAIERYDNSKLDAPLEYPPRIEIPRRA